MGSHWIWITVTFESYNRRMLSAILLLSPLGKRQVKLKSPSSGMLWIKFAWKFLSHVILVFSYYHPFEMGIVLHLNNSILFIKGYFVQNLLKLAPWIFEKTKIWKACTARTTTTTTKLTDNWQFQIRKANLSLVVQIN